MTTQQAKKIAAYLATMCDVPAWTVERLAFFAEAIQDLDYPEAMQAAREFVKVAQSGKFQGRVMPSHIREIVSRDHLGQIPGPEQAWAELHEALQHDCEPRFTHPLIAEALRCAGHDWRSARLVQFDQYPWLKRDFCNALCELTSKALAASERAPGCEPPQIPSREEARKLLAAIIQTEPLSSSPAAPDGDWTPERVRSTLRAAREQITTAVSRDHECVGHVDPRRREQLRRQLAELKARGIE